MNLYPHVDEIICDVLDLHAFPPGKSRSRINIISDGKGDPIQLPVMSIKGRESGPVLGITAAIHGNELNGIPIIHQLMDRIDPKKIKGHLMAFPVINVPGYLQNTRDFSDGTDLNRLFPGKKNGASGEVFVYHFMKRVVKHLEYLIDLHTASFGRENSLYVKADLNRETTSMMAYLQHPQIIVNNPGVPGTLRTAATKRGINAITVEIGNPHRFQKKLIQSTIRGILNILHYLEIIPGNFKMLSQEPVICKKSYWLYTDRGGILEVFPHTGHLVRKGETIAHLKNIFGDIIQVFAAPADGIVIGKNINPIENAGSRILHLGILE